MRLGRTRDIAKNSVLIGLFSITAVICNGVQIYVNYISGINFTGVIATIYSLYQNYSHVLLGMFLFLLMKTCFDRFKYSVKAMQMLDVADNYSYETYLVHQFFILGPFSLMALTPVFPINTDLYHDCYVAT